MKKFVLFFVVVAYYCVAFGRFSYSPMERDYYSENGHYSVHTLPSSREQAGDIAAISVRWSQSKENRYRKWGCSLGYEGMPKRCYVSNGGKTVVAVDQVTLRKTGGYGDYTLAFYNKDGLVKKYSAAELLGFPAGMSVRELEKKMGRFVEDSFPWDEESVEFIDEVEGVEYFCMWLPIIEKWRAWEVATGELIWPSNKMKSNWVEKAREKVLKETKNGANSSVYLGYLKRPQDRQLIENALHNNWYTRGGAITRNNKLLMVAGSSERKRVEQILAAWDQGVNIYEILRIKMPSQGFLVLNNREKRAKISLPHMLGWVEGVVEMPELENPKEAALWIYLVKADEEFNSCDNPPVHKLAVSFKDFSFKELDTSFTRKLSFRFEDVTPGKYRVSVVLDRTDPPNHSYSIKCCFKQAGDYTNAIEPVVEVLKGKVVKGVSISCASLVE